DRGDRGGVDCRTLGMGHPAPAWRVFCAGHVRLWGTGQVGVAGRGELEWRRERHSGYPGSVAARIRIRYARSVLWFGIGDGTVVHGRLVVAVSTSAGACDRVRA